MIGHLTRSFTIRAIITVAVLAVMLSRIDGAATMAALGRLDGRILLLVLLLIAVDRGVMVWRWIVLLRATGQQISAKSATWIFLVSSFVGGFLPAGIGGDLARAYTLTQRTAQGGAAIASVAADRLLGVLSIVLVALAGAAIWEGDAETRRIVSAGALLALALCGALLWADLWVRRTLPRALQERRLGIRLMRYADALAAYRNHQSALIVVLVLSIGVQLLRIGQTYLLGRGIGIDVPFVEYLVFMPIGLIALLLPISISGFGAPQGIIVWLLEPRGAAVPDAFALSTLIVLSGIAGNLPGALLYLREARKKRR